MITIRITVDQFNNGYSTRWNYPPNEFDTGFKPGQLDLFYKGGKLGTVRDIDWTHAPKFIRVSYEQEPKQ